MLLNIAKYNYTIKKWQYKTEIIFIYENKTVLNFCLMSAVPLLA